MKTIAVPVAATELNSLLEQARDEDVLLQAADGTEFIVTAVDDFDHEIVRSRLNARLMALLEQRAAETGVVPLAEVKRQFGLSN